MRIIPKKTKVTTEFFKGLSLSDILLGFIGAIAIFLVVISTLPCRGWIALGLGFLFGLLLIHIDDEPNYKFLRDMLRHYSIQRGYQKLPDDAYFPSGWKEKRKKIRKKHKKGEKAASTSAENEDADLTEVEKEDGERPSSFERPKETAVTDEEALVVQSNDPNADDAANVPPLSKAEQKQQKKALAQAAKAKVKAKKAEDRFLKSKKIPEEQKTAIRERRAQEAQERYEKAKLAEQKAKRVDIEQLYLVSEISGGFICYNNAYYGAVIEIPAVDFRFFSEHRQDNAIERALGNVIRSCGHKYATNLVKLERPLMMDAYIQTENEKIESLKKSFERGVFNEQELQSRVEVIFDRINSLYVLNTERKVLAPYFYLVLFDSDRRQLDNQVRSALNSLRQGEMFPRRLGDKELVAFLKYSNCVDFDEREIENLDPGDYARYVMPDSVEITPRTVEINNIITHNFRVKSYPLRVGNAWGASLFDLPGTKVVMKFSQLDRQKSVRAIDRSISELNSQLDTTGVSSRVLELQTHIETLSDLLVTLQNDNESLMSTNMYITGYDIAATRDNKLLVPQPPLSALPNISNMKKDIMRSFREQSFRLNDLHYQQFDAFVATQINGYDPFASKSLGIPSNTLAAVFPWVYASLQDVGGINLGTTSGVPSFIDFFRRDSERVNSNMVIVGKSGGGKSYATKSILTNLAADDSKIFVLDPENEYAELAANLHGKFINVANASHGRINPFQIITSLEDDEAEVGQETSSYAAHLQFLEEFFRQILPDVESDAMEYLNTLINRVYSQKNIDQFTDLPRLRPIDYPTFDDLYDCILEEFQRSKSDYLKANLRVLMNYVAKFSTGGRNASIWNGPSTLSTLENFIVFNFQSLLANRNNTIANAQMLLVLKYLDSEIIKNREYNTRYGANRKIVVVIDEAHVFIDTKYPLALDFMFQLAKRIRKYNGMQIVITQNIKDFVGSEELARKSTAIINACQYSLIFSLAPNDMTDLCTLYEKAGGINESEQEQIISAARGHAFVVTSPTSRTSMQIETSQTVEELFSRPGYTSHYFSDEGGEQVWEETVEASREARQEALGGSEKESEAGDTASPLLQDVEMIEVGAEDEEEVLLMDDEQSPEPQRSLRQPLDVEESGADSPFSPDFLQRFGFEALVNEIKRTVRAELTGEGVPVPAVPTVAAVVGQAAAPNHAAPAEKKSGDDWLAAPAEKESDDGWLAAPAEKESGDDWFAAPAEKKSGGDWLATPAEKESDDDWLAPSVAAFAAINQSEDDFFSRAFDDLDTPEASSAETEDAVQPEENVERPLVYEVTLDELMAMTD